MVVVAPVRHTPQRGPGLESLGLEEHGHQGHEPAVRAAVDADALGVRVVVRSGVVDAVFEIFELGVAHVAVDGRAPVAPVALRRTEVGRDNDEALVVEQRVHHVLAEVVGPLVVGVLQVAGPVREDDQRARAGESLRVGQVHPRPDRLLGMGRGYGDDLGDGQINAEELIGDGVRELLGRGVRDAQVLYVELGRQVQVGIGKDHARLVGRELVTINCAFHLGDRRQRPGGEVEAFELLHTGVLAVRAVIHGRAVAGELDIAHLVPLARERCPGIALGLVAVETSEVGFFGDIPERVSARDEPELVEAPVDPGLVAQVVGAGHRGVAIGIESLGVHQHDPAVLVVV